MPKVTVQGVGEVTFPDDMSHEEIAHAIETDILPHATAAAAAPAPTGRAFVAAHQRTDGLPGDQVNFVEPTLAEGFKSGVAHLATAIPAGVAQTLTLPADAIADLASSLVAEPKRAFSPSRETTMPLTEGVGSIQQRAAQALRDAAGVRRGAITDTTDAANDVLGTLVGGAVAGHLGLDPVAAIRPPAAAEIPTRPSAVAAAAEHAESGVGEPRGPLAPPVAPSQPEPTVRLYRAEPVDPTVNLGSFDLTSAHDDLASPDREGAVGGWYTRSREKAAGYADDIERLGHRTQIRHVDVPASEAESYRAANHPAASNYATDLEHDHFVPAEVRAKSQVEVPSSDIEQRLSAMNRQVEDLYAEADRAADAGDTAKSRELEARGHSIADAMTPLYEEQRKATAAARSDARPAKAIEDMSLDELRAHAKDLATKVYQSDVVDGVGNRRAWNEHIKPGAKHIASIDVDNLKAANDDYGHLSGDALIAANGEALRIAAEEHGAKVAHISGDEFKVAAGDAETLQKVRDRARQIIAEGDIMYTDPDGNQVALPKDVVKGFSYGIGRNEAAAEVALKRDKAERLASGIRTERRSTGDVAESTDPRGQSEAGREVHPAPSEIADEVSPPRPPPNEPPAPPSGGAPPQPPRPDPSAPGEPQRRSSLLLASLHEIKDGLVPSAASPEAGVAAGRVREARAKIANDSSIERFRNKDISKTFSRASDAENIARISNYERTGQFTGAPAGYAEMFKRSLDAAHDALTEAYGEDRVGYVENYVRRAYKFGSKADEARATAILTNEIGSLSANRSVLKGRVLTMPLDEALQTLRAKGIKVEPVTTNPELLRQWSVENATQALVYKQTWADAKESGLIAFQRSGNRVPEGLVPLDDRVARVFAPSEVGPVEVGRYYAEPGVARIFNNAISKGLGGSPTYRGIRAINNAYNQMQLGLSGFHLVGTAINATVSDVALGMSQLVSGDTKGLSTLARGAVPGMSFVRDVVKGNRFVNALVASDPAARAILEERFNPAGGRLAIQQTYLNAAAEKMSAAWKQNRVLAAMGHLPFAIVEKIASPLMEYAIPRVKIATFLELAEHELERAPNVDAVTRRKILARAWDSIDNRFGQLVHDNLFWNKTARDLSQVAVRSVGWNLGTIRELGGAGVDVAKTLKGGGATPRMYYAAALPITAGMIGAVYQVLHTGEMPASLKDYFYPRNGLKDSRGNADRVSLPTYMKDGYAYADHPVATLMHKASPLLSMAADLATNRDYNGDMVRNPADPASVQLLQLGKYAAKQFLPFSLTQMGNLKDEGASTFRSLEQFGGFVRAPGSIRATDAQRESDLNRAHAPRTPEQQEKGGGRRHRWSPVSGR